MRTNRKLLALSAAIASMAVLGCGDEGNAPPPPTGAMSLTLDPATRSVVQGGTATITATVTRTAPFAGPVALVFESAQAGLTGTFAPDTVAAGATSSTLTLAAAASVAPGDYPVTVRARAAGLTEQVTTATVTVTQAPSFTLAATPDAISIEQGSASVSLARVTRVGGFAAPIALAVSGLPDSITATVATPSLAGDSTSVNFVVGTSVAPGAYAAIFTATATGLDPRADTVAITVTRRPSYTLAIAPESVSVVQGQAGSALVRLTRDSGYTSNVTLSIDSLPAGIAAVPAQAVLPGDTTSLAITVGAAVAPGTYPIVVRGDAVNRPQTVDTLRLTVVAAPAAIALAVDGDSVGVVQGRDTSLVIRLTRTNYTDTIAVAVTGLPAGVTATVAPTTGDSTVALLTVGDSAALGTVTVVFTGSGSGVASASDSLTLTVSAPASTSSRIRGTRTTTDGVTPPEPMTRRLVARRSE